MKIDTYWDKYYNSSGTMKNMPPSQFAAFVAVEARGAEIMCEIGCGSGRDSFFFARHGFEVVAIDSSEVAIQKAIEVGKKAGIYNVEFCCASVGDDSFTHTLKEIVERRREGNVVFYARFFLHAITDDQETELLSKLATYSRKGDFIYFEFRTKRDVTGIKVTEEHYRRYLSPSELFVKAAEHGFTVEYAVEGYGFAKYFNDDAYVGRCILCKK